MIIEEKEIIDQNDEPLIYTVSDLAEAVAEAIAKEREACAKVCDWWNVSHCAAAIRARGEK
jgi:hypothetical protein